MPVITMSVTMNLILFVIVTVANLVAADEAKGSENIFAPEQVHIAKGGKSLKSIIFVNYKQFNRDLLQMILAAW